MIQLIFRVTFAIAVIGSMALGQTPSTSTSIASGPNGASEMTATTTESEGVVTEFIPGTLLFLKTEAAEPVQYRFSPNVTYLTSDGRVVETSRIKKASKVRVRYVKEGNDTLVDKVIVSDGD